MDKRNITDMTVGIKKRSTRAEIKRMDRAYIAKKLIDDGMNQSEVARVFGVSRQAINQLLYRHKMNARKAVYRNIKAGALIKSDTCESCGAVDRIQASHDDYGEQLNVKWFCEPCHARYDNRGK